MANNPETNVDQVQGGGKEQEQPQVVNEKSIEVQKVEEKNDGQKEEDNIVEVEEENDGDGKEDPSQASGVEKAPPPYKGESDLLSDLREYEKKALLALRSKIEEAILENKLYDDVKRDVEEVKEKPLAKDREEKENQEGGDIKEGNKEGDAEKIEGVGEKGVSMKEEDKTEQINVAVEGKGGIDVKENVELWGIPLLSTIGDKRTDVILLKFLRARDFNANHAFELLKKVLQWRKENGIDSIIDEDFEANYGPIAFMLGNDLEGHPICYNVCGVLANEEMYEKILGSEEKREKFFRWRIQLMEKGVKKLDFKPRGSDADGGGISKVVQVIDLKNTPLPTKKELRLGIRKAIELFLDSYPEFSAQNLFINVPFWYYAFSALFAPSLTQRTKNKFVFARASRVTDTLLKYIAVEELPIQYGGLKRESDPDFNIEDTAKDVTIKAGTSETIEIPAPEVGNVIIWDLTVSGWDVNYKEEFVPIDEKSYSVIVQRGRKITWQEGPIRNSFQNKEPGNIAITIDNTSYKKKRILYRYKSKQVPSTTSS